MGIKHCVCGVHMLDLSVEDNYNPDSGNGIQAEIDKFIAIRKFLTQTSSIEKDYLKAQAQRKEGKSSSFPINSMVRFVTHKESFDHVRENWKSCNEIF